MAVEQGFCLPFRRVLHQPLSSCFWGHSTYPIVMICEYLNKNGTTITLMWPVNRVSSQCHLLSFSGIRLWGEGSDLKLQVNWDIQGSLRPGTLRYSKCVPWTRSILGCTRSIPGCRWVLDVELLVLPQNGYASESLGQKLLWRKNSEWSMCTEKIESYKVGWAPGVSLLYISCQIFEHHVVALCPIAGLIIGWNQGSQEIIPQRDREAGRPEKMYKCICLLPKTDGPSLALYKMVILDVWGQIDANRNFVLI